jgi:hypothetical protein
LHSYWRDFAMVSRPMRHFPNCLRGSPERHKSWMATNPQLVRLMQPRFPGPMRPEFPATGTRLPCRSTSASSALGGQVERGEIFRKDRSHKIPRVEGGKLLCFRPAESYVYHALLPKFVHFLKQPHYVFMTAS